MASVNIKARSGNRIIVTLDGKQIGAIQSVRFSEDYSPEPVTGIGDIEVQEWVPTVARYTVSVSTMVLLKNSLRSAGITSVDSAAVLEGLVFDIVSIDKDTGDVIRKYSGCSYASGEVEVQKNAIVMASAQFNALKVSGEEA